MSRRDGLLLVAVGLQPLSARVVGGLLLWSCFGSDERNGLLQGLVVLEGGKKNKSCAFLCFSPQSVCNQKL